MIKTVKGTKLWVSPQLSDYFSWHAVLIAGILGWVLGFVIYCMLGAMIFLAGRATWLSQYSDILGPLCTFVVGPVLGVLVLCQIRLSWKRWIPKGTVAQWDGLVLSAFRRELKKHDIMFLDFDKAECSRETALLHAYLQKFAVTTPLKTVQEAMDESASEVAALIARFRQVGKECDELVERYSDVGGNLGHC